MAGLHLKYNTLVAAYNKPLAVRVGCVPNFTGKKEAETCTKKYIYIFYIHQTQCRQRRSTNSVVIYLLSDSCSSFKNVEIPNNPFD